MEKVTEVKDRPRFYTEEHKDYLDNLRESGAVNMFKAAEYLQDAFDMPKKDAREAIFYWMKNFK